jgi:neutral ceramidase
MGYDARQSSGVHDPIYHRVVALESGGEQIFLAASDLCLFSPAVYDDVARQLEQAIGLSRTHFWWSVTHTHAAPEVGAPGLYRSLLGRSDHEWNRGYETFVTKSLIGAVLAAREKLQPARIGFGQGIAMANINRRARDEDGTVSLGLNPDGPADRQIGVVRLERPDGTLVALIANYAINGAAGNLSPIYHGHPDVNSGHLSEFRVLLGDHILAALCSMGPAAGDLALEVEEKTIATPRREGLEGLEELNRYAAPPEAPGGPARIKLPVRFSASTTRSSGRRRSSCFAKSPSPCATSRRSRTRFTSAIPTDGSATCPRHRPSPWAATSRKPRPSPRGPRPMSRKG